MITTYTKMPQGCRLYTKRPIPIQAIQINIPFNVESKEGIMSAKAGDYLISGIKGELYSCDKEIFEESYELLNK